MTYLAAHNKGILVITDQICVLVMCPLVLHHLVEWK